MTDGHGDDLYRYGDKVRSNFSTNICSAVDHTALLEHLAGMGERIKSYPEPTPVSVESCLAGQLDIPAEAVMVTNGATETIYLIAQSRYGGRSQIVVPTFREYQDACRLFRHQIRFISGIDSVNSGSDLVWLCNPNNPTGNVTERDRLVECIRSHPDVLFVIDQAYADYTELPVLIAGPTIIVCKIVASNIATATTPDKNRFTRILFLILFLVCITLCPFLFSFESDVAACMIVT